MTRASIIVAALAAVLLTACGAAPDRAGDATLTASEGESVAPPCDPGAGSPVDVAGCPDPEPDTGWLSASGGDLTLKPFRTLGNDPEGKAYARDHDVEYPFPNDYFDAADGPRHSVAIDESTMCTGIIQVDYQEPLTDHVVGCEQLVQVAGRQPVPVAVWLADEEVMQVSELYRP